MPNVDSYFKTLSYILISCHVSSIPVRESGSVFCSALFFFAVVWKRGKRGEVDMDMDVNKVDC